MDNVLTKCEYSAHSPSIELHGMLKERVPMLISLLINSYFRMWLGIDKLCQNLSVVRTNWFLLLVVPNLHLSSNVRYSQIFSKISFGNCSIDAIGGSKSCVFFEFLYESRPFSGCIAQSMPSIKSCFLILHLVLGCEATKQ